MGWSRTGALATQDNPSGLGSPSRGRARARRLEEPFPPQRTADIGSLNPSIAVAEVLPGELPAFYLPCGFGWFLFTLLGAWWGETNRRVLCYLKHACESPSDASGRGRCSASGTVPPAVSTPSPVNPYGSLEHSGHLVPPQKKLRACLSSLALLSSFPASAAQLRSHWDVVHTEFRGTGFVIGLSCLLREMRKKKFRPGHWPMSEVWRHSVLVRQEGWGENGGTN